MFKEIQITSLEVKGFKIFKDSMLIEFNPEGKTIIEAENYRGKTSIGEAIVWAFLGTNLWGNDKADSDLLNDKSKTMSVIVRFIADGENHFLARTRQGKQTSIILDNYNIKQNELTRKLGSKEIFLSIFNLEYFNNMSDKDGRDFLISILEKIPIEDIKEKIDETTLSFIDSDILMVHANPNNFIKVKRADIRELEKDIIFAEGKISEIEEITIADTTKEFDNTRISEIEYQLEKYNFNPNQELIRKIEDLRINKNKIEVETSVISSEKIENTEELQKLRENISTISNEKFDIKEEDKKEIILLKNKLNQLREQYAKEREIPLKIGDNCPICKTIISEPHLAILEEEMKTKLHLIKKEGDDTSLKLNQLKENSQNTLNQLNEIKEKKRDELQEKYNNLKKELENIKQKKVTFLRNKIVDINNIIVELEQKQEEELKETKDEIKVLKEELLILKKEKKEIDEYNMKIRIRTEKTNENQKKFKKLTREIEGHTKEILYNSSQINAAQLYTSIKAKLLSKLIHENLTDVSIELQKTIKSTGELKDCFEIRYKNRKMNTSSSSERIRAGLEISNLIINQLGLKYPVFLDNGESITHYKAPNVQVIETRVVKGKELFEELEEAI